jgi:hypothetical protein
MREGLELGKGKWLTALDALRAQERDTVVLRLPVAVARSCKGHTSVVVHTLPCLAAAQAGHTGTHKHTS